MYLTQLGGELFVLSMRREGKIDDRAGLQPLSKTPGTSEQNTNFSVFPAQGCFVMQDMGGYAVHVRRHINKLPTIMEECHSQ